MQISLNTNTTTRFATFFCLAKKLISFISWNRICQIHKIWIHSSKNSRLWLKRNRIYFPAYKAAIASWVAGIVNCESLLSSIDRGNLLDNSLAVWTLILLHNRILYLSSTSSMHAQESRTILPSYSHVLIKIVSLIVHRYSNFCPVTSIMKIAG